MHLDELDDFSRGFADALFALCPELRKHATARDGTLEIDMHPGRRRADCSFWLTTENDEITVGLGPFHTHLNWPPSEHWPEDRPVEFVRSVMDDETLIEARYCNGEWTGSSTHDPDDPVDASSLGPGEFVHVRSWSGDRDRTIRAH